MAFYDRARCRAGPPPIQENGGLGEKDLPNDIIYWISIYSLKLFSREAHRYKILFNIFQSKLKEINRAS